MSKPWEETWYVVQVADTSGFGEHAGQWWVYSSPSGSPLFGYQGPPVPEGHANLGAAAPELYRALLTFAKEECRCRGDLIPGGPCRHELANAVLRKARGE